MTSKPFPNPKAVRLKYLQNKEKAAVCYEKGHVYKEVLALYEEMNQDEKVDGLYLVLNNKAETDKFFQKGIDNIR
jgi:hypothetical protein